MEGQQGGGRGRMGGKGTRKHNWYAENRQGNVKNSIGNWGAKDLVCMTHGHELKEEMLEGGVVQGGGG